MSSAAGEVVAGAQREQAEHRARRGRGGGGARRPPRAGCRRRRPPRSVATPARWSTPSSSPGSEVALHLDRRAARGGSPGPRSRASSSAVPASPFVITRRGSTRRTLAEASEPAVVPPVGYGRDRTRPCRAPCRDRGRSYRAEEVRDARDRGPRRPVGRRGQGQGHRPARHHRDRSTTSSAPAAATTPATPSWSTARSSPPTCCPAASSRPGCTSRDRQRRRGLARGAVPRARRAGRARRRRRRASSSAPTRT